MPIKRQAPKNAFGQYLERKANELRHVMLNNLIYVGEQAITEARERGRYNDQTGNLRSSIGYCVLDNGKPVVIAGFKVVKDGKQGAQQGRKFLESLISEHSTGLVLIVVAGMEYAQYVEAMNLNVLDSAEQMAQKLVPQLIKALKL